MNRAHTQRDDVCYSLTSCCVDRFVRCGFSYNFCLTCFFSLVVVTLFFCIGSYLYLFETASLQVGSEYFFYFCLLLGFEVLLILSGCILCVFADQAAAPVKRLNPKWKRTQNLKYKVDNSQRDISLATPDTTISSRNNSSYVAETKHLLANDDGTDSDLDNFVTGDSSSDEEDWQSAVGEDEIGSLRVV